MNTKNIFTDRVGLILFDKSGEKLLLVSEISQKMGFPKGTFEKGESLQKAALRHLVKDTGIDLSSTSYHCMGKYLIKYSQRSIIFLYQMQLDEEPFYQPIKNCKKMHWVSCKDLPKIVSSQANLYNSPVHNYIKKSY